MVLLSAMACLVFSGVKIGLSDSGSLAIFSSRYTKEFVRGVGSGIGELFVKRAGNITR